MDYFRLSIEASFFFTNHNSLKNLIDSSSYSESPQNLFTILLPSFT